MLRVADIPGTGAFTVSVGSLVPGTDYTFKAYATNSLGTGYSNAATFRTAANQRPSITVTGGVVRHYLTRSLAVPRVFHTVNLLAGGSVLATGGHTTGNIVGVTSTEIYHPSIGQWTTGANMNIPRTGHNATLLASGRLLVTGGYSYSTMLRSVEIFNPATGSWTAAASMAAARTSHTATLLNDGRVLVTGGLQNSLAVNSTEIYDPASGVWSSGSPMSAARSGHTATLLPNGKVLVSGGSISGSFHATAELFDPVDGTWTATGSMINSRSRHTATQLADGRVLVSGGEVVISITPFFYTLQSSEIYDPVVGTWSVTGNRVSGTSEGSGTLMPDGRVIAAGGSSGNSFPLYSSEVYNPTTGFWDLFATLTAPRSDAPMILLPGGQLLLVGGRNTISGAGILSSTELLGPLALLPSGAEGSAVSRTGTFSDPEGNGTVTLSASAGTITQNNAAGTWNWTGTRGDGPADAVVTITATDSSGASGSVAISFPVTNAVPTLAVSGPLTALTGSSVDFTLTASDPSPVDEATGFAWSFNFGDGTAPLTVAAGTASPVVRSHVFANSGVYTVTATAADKDGGVSLTASHQITIAGPPSIIPFNYPSSSATTFTAAANVLSDGGSAVTERGIISSPAAINLNPEIGGAGVSSLASTSQGTGPFTLSLANLTPLTSYRYRFYAINSQGTSYTAVQSFTTTSNHAPLLGLNGAAGTFTATGSLVTPRSEHAATLLPDGKVLVTGGFAGGKSLREGELCNPATGLWTAAPGMAAERLWHTTTLLTDGNLLVAGGSLYPSGNRHQTTELFESATGTWLPMGNLSSPRHQHTATLLQDGQVLAAGGGTSVAELFNPATGLWTPLSGSATSRSGHTATLLNDGRVLVTGGILGDGTQIPTTEIFDPATRTWSTAAATATPHHYHTSNLLPNGKVIVTGGYINNTGLIGGVEIYDPVTNSWAPGASPAARRIRHASALLPDGRLLISGGLTTGNEALGSAELYDPVTGQWANGGSSASVRSQHTAIPFPNGKVLVAGGTGTAGPNGSVEWYDRQTTAAGLEASPITQSGTFYDAEGNATVTLTASSGTVTQDNAAGTWTWATVAGDGPAASPVTITATDSLNGTTRATFTLNTANALPAASIAGPATGDAGTALNYTFSATDLSPADVDAGFAWTLNFGDGTGPQSIPAGTASPLLRSHAFGSPGTFTITASATDKDGGVSTVASQQVSITGPPVVSLPVISGMSSFDAILGGTISHNGGYPLTERGIVYSMTALNDAPVIGGAGVTKLTNPVNSTGSFTAHAVNLTPGTSYTFRVYAINAKGTSYSNSATFTTSPNRAPALAVDGAGSTPAFTATSNLAVPRAFHTAVRLGNGKVLVAGGSTGTGPPFRSAEVYDPATGLWTATAGLIVARDSAKAVLLPNGKVFVTGGVGPEGYVSSTEWYDPETGTWSSASGMAYPRYSHTATVLANGKVLVAGGQGDNGSTAHSEIYDPADGTWTSTGSLLAARYAHTATLLNNGKVLVTGGWNSNLYLASSEIYDPATGSWTATGSLASGRRYHTETLLTDGRVLVTGGQSSTNYTGSTEIYQPMTGTWTTGPSLTTPRYRHTATLLRDSKVLISGGFDGGFPLNSTALYDPAAHAWSPAAILVPGRLAHSSTLLADGRVLIAGGNGSFLANPLASTVIFGPAAPVVSIGEGLPSTKTGTFSDYEGNAAVTLTASYGAITQNIPNGTWSWSAPGEDGPSTTSIILTAKDAHGGISRATFSFTVTNRPPTTTITAPGMAAARVPVNFSFTASDPAAADQAAGFAWTLNFGDGSPAETFPGGTATPLDRSHVFAVAGTYTVTATATDKNSGTSTPASKTITVLDGMAGWRLTHFGSTNDSGNAAILFDADGDGLVNLTEFAFGLNPTSGASAQLPAARVLDGHLVITFPEPPGVAGSLIYRAEWSGDLSSGIWLPVPDTGTGGTHTFSVPMAGRTKVFIRLVVTAG